MWELESQFRSLGEEYSCFSMPYWDVTHDAEAIKSLDTVTAGGIPIYNSHLGGEGDVANFKIVKGSEWALDRYTTDYACINDTDHFEPFGHCALKREPVTEHSFLPKAKLFEKAIAEQKYNVFLSVAEALHGYIHVFVGQSSCWRCDTQMGGGASPADPLFFLLHSFLDYVRLLRTDCWQFDRIPLHDLDQYDPYSWTATSSFPDLSMDSVMRYLDICSASNVDSAFCAEHDVKIRDLWDMTRWGVTYELGSFWAENQDIQMQCDGNLNASWFYSEDEVHDQMLAVAVSAWTDIAVGPQSVVLMAILLILGLAACAQSIRQRKGDVETTYLECKVLPREGGYGAL